MGIEHTCEEIRNIEIMILKQAVHQCLSQVDKFVCINILKLSKDISTLSQYIQENIWHQGCNSVFLPILYGKLFLYFISLIFSMSVESNLKYLEGRTIISRYI